MGIRTPDTLLAHTRFPIVLLRPARTSLRVPTAALLMQQLYILTQRQFSDKREFPQQRSNTPRSRKLAHHSRNACAAATLADYPQLKARSPRHAARYPKHTPRTAKHASRSTHHSARSSQRKGRNPQRGRRLHTLPLHQPRTPGLFPPVPSRSSCVVYRHQRSQQAETSKHLSLSQTFAACRHKSPRSR